MDIKLYKTNGKSEGKVSVSDVLFGAPAKADLVYQVATAQMSNKRKVLAHAKTRSEVRGGGRKPWRQKGTGKARHGSIRSPIWIGGGVAHGPSKDVNFKKKINRGSAKAALASVLSSRLKEGRFMVVDALAVQTGKTRDAAKAFTTLAKGFDGYKAGGRILFLSAGGAGDEKTRRATGNLPYVDVVRASDLNVLIALSYPYLVATKEAVTVLEKPFTLK